MDDPEILFYIATITNGQESKQLLFKSSKLGHREAQYSYGIRYCSDAHFFMAATQDHIPSLYEMGVICSDRNKYVEAVDYFNRALEIIFKTREYVCYFRDGTRCAKYKPSLELELIKVYLNCEVKNGMTTIKFYLKHDMYKVVNTIINQNDEYKESILQSVYVYKGLKTVSEDILLLIFRNVKETIETDHDIYMDDYIKCLDFHFEYHERMIKKMRDTLDGSSLYVKTLHDVIEKYIYN